MEKYTLSEPQPVPPTQDDPPPTTSSVKQPKRMYVIAGIAVGFLIMFLLGFIVSSASKPKVTVSPATQPTPTTVVRKVTSNPSSPPREINTSIQYLPGKQYFDDSVAIITKGEPRKALLVSVSRYELEKTYTQYAKVNYYDGTTWSRENITTSILTSSILPNPLISNFSIKPYSTRNTQDPSRIDVRIANKPVSFILQRIGIDLSTRAFQGYSKFNYFGEGVLKTPEGDAAAYLFFTQSYSANASDVGFFAHPERLQSNWFVFWDAFGNAYHLDSLSSDQESNILQNYRIGFISYIDGSFKKLQNVSVRKGSRTHEYSVSFVTNPVSDIQFVITAPFNKSTDKVYNWPTGIITGNVTSDKKTTDGIGLWESLEKVQ